MDGVSLAQAVNPRRYLGTATTGFFLLLPAATLREMDERERLVPGAGSCPAGLTTAVWGRQSPAGMLPAARRLLAPCRCGLIGRPGVGDALRQREAPGANGLPGIAVLEVQARRILGRWGGGGGRLLIQDIAASGAQVERGGRLGSERGPKLCRALRGIVVKAQADGIAVAGTFAAIGVGADAGEDGEGELIAGRKGAIVDRAKRDRSPPWPYLGCGSRP